MRNEWIEVVVGSEAERWTVDSEVEEAKSDDVTLSNRSNMPRLMHVHKKVIPDNHILRSKALLQSTYASLRSILSCTFQIIAYVVIVHRHQACGRQSIHESSSQLDACIHGS